MAERVASPVLVGRRAELAALQAALASPGRTAAVLVGGEAGTGKSRLVAEFTTAAAVAGTRVLAGACVALGAESLPYAPFMGVLGQLAAEVGPDGIEALVGPGRVDLARLVPELRRPGDDSRPPGPAERAVLFQVVLRTLEALGARAPLVVVIEDYPEPRESLIPAESRLFPRYPSHRSHEKALARPPHPGAHQRPGAFSLCAPAVRDPPPGGPHRHDDRRSSSEASYGSEQCRPSVIPVESPSVELPRYDGSRLTMRASTPGCHLSPRGGR